ncbi:kinase-like protein [Trametes cingulata]|nr:kinase-like protein [Trametes cingulata]
MAPLRRERPRYSQSTTPLDSGFASASHSKTLAYPRTKAGNHTTRVDNGQPEGCATLATTCHISSRPPPLRLQDMESVRILGTGAWGAVHVARVKRRRGDPKEQPEAAFALKVVRKSILRDLERNERTPNREQAAEKKNAERRTLASLPWNPFISGILDAYVDAKNVYISLELGVVSNLYTEMRRSFLTEPEIRFYFANIVLALEFLHTQGIIHCDVKPENLVLGADGYLLLTDFGLAQPLDEEGMWNRMGTLEYMSPEVLSDENVDTAEKRIAADWWSAAVCLFELKTLVQPFECDSLGDLVEKQANAPLPWPEYPRRLEEFEDLVSRMLTVHLEHRYGARVVPEGKGGALINKEIRTHPYFAPVNWERIEKRVAAVPRIPPSYPDPTNQRHTMPFVEQTKVPALPLKRPSPRLEWLDIKREKEECPRKKRRMAGEFSMCLQPSPSMTATRGSGATAERS